MQNTDQKKLNILSLYYGKADSAAVLLQDGKVVAGAKEEWFTGKKGDCSFPLQSINFCLQSQDLIINNISAVTFPDKPFLRFYSTILTHLKKYPFSLFGFLKEMPSWLSEGLLVDFTMREKLGYEGDIYFIPNHHAHAAAAFYSSPFNEALVLVYEDGEKHQISWGIGNEAGLELKQSLDYKKSLPPTFFKQLLKELQKKTNLKNICLSGSFFQENPLDEEMLSHIGFSNKHSSPLLNHAGATLGSAFMTYSKVLQGENIKRLDDFKIGPRFSLKEIQRASNLHQLRFQERDSRTFTTDPEALCISSPLSFNSEDQSIDLDHLMENWKTSSSPQLILDSYVITKN